MGEEISIVFHGRGGQGAVKASQILAYAASLEGKYVQAFPNFGIERQGAPLEAYCRISNKKIFSRNEIINPDYAVVLDETLLNIKKIEAKEIIINSEDKKFTKTFDATKLALEILGKNIVNTSMLAVFCYYTKIVSKENLLLTLKEFFSGKILEKNTEIINQTFEKLGKK